MREEPMRQWGDLRDSGLLWLINRVVFHPRGFALALCMEDGEPAGWRLLGDGAEVWTFNDEEDDVFARAERTLNDRRPAS